MQGWLAMVFLAAGYAKLSATMTVLGGLLSWVRPEFEPFVRALGVAEICLGLSMVTPLLSWTIGHPVVRLGAVTMAGLAGAMSVLGAIKGDFGSFLLNIALVGLSVTVAVGRWRHTEPV